MSLVDIEKLRTWVGKTRESSDVVTAAPVAALHATLDRPPGAEFAEADLPPCWHWLFFQEAVAASGLGEDGHPRRGEFLPPVPLPRRMWAGSRLQFHSSLGVGDEVRRVSTITAVEHKRGRSGDLVFVTVAHRIFSGETLAIEEEQDLVYRPRDSALRKAPAVQPPASAHWHRQIVPDPVLLFRYSALTFNSHRIHYDREYTTVEEGYPALVVQGPLLATLLLDLLHRELPGARLRRFEFRALRPAFAGEPLHLRGSLVEKQVRLSAQGGADGAPAVAALAWLDN